VLLDSVYRNFIPPFAQLLLELYMQTSPSFYALERWDPWSFDGGWVFICYVFNMCFYSMYQVQAVAIRPRSYRGVKNLINGSLRILTEELILVTRL